MIMIMVMTTKIMRVVEQIRHYSDHQNKDVFVDGSNDDHVDDHGDDDEDDHDDDDNDDESC